MTDLLHSFGCGIAFSAGVFIGITAMLLARSTIDAKRDKRIEEASDSTVSLLRDRNAINERIARALEDRK